MKTPLPSTPFYLQAAATLTVAGVVFLSYAKANLVVNGDFETSTAIAFSTGGTAVGGGDAPTWESTLSNQAPAGWTVAGSQVANVVATNANLYYGTISEMEAPGGGPHSGNVAAVFPNFPTYDGSISQLVTTTAVGIYQISFWLGNQVGDAALNSMTVEWGGTTLLGPSAIPLAPGWSYHQFNVFTSSPTTLLEFTGGADSSGLLLDDIVVVPEVSSFGILTGLGLLALGSMVRLRRRALVTA